MKTFNKIIISQLIFCCTFIIISYIVICIPCKMEACYFQDAKIRERLAGKINFLIIGGSHALSAINPIILDKTLECNSYNCSATLQTSYNRKFFTKKEVSRNPIKTIVLEISYNAFQRDEINEDPGDSHIVAIQKREYIYEKFEYIYYNMPINCWQESYSYAFIINLRNGIINLYSKIMKKENINSMKGFHPKEINNLQENIQYIHNNFNKNEMYSSGIFNDITLKGYKDLFKFCKKNNCRLIVVVTPLSLSYLWKYKDFDLWSDLMKQLSCQYNFEYYDFNLYKKRFDNYPDECAFNDSVHMSYFGAEKFTEDFANILIMHENGIDLSDLFYISYEEMKKKSPYMDMYNHN